MYHVATTAALTLRTVVQVECFGGPNEGNKIDKVVHRNLFGLHRHRRSFTVVDGDDTHLRIALGTVSIPGPA